MAEVKGSFQEVETDGLEGLCFSDGVSVKYLDDRFEDFCLRAAGSGHPD